MLAYYLCLLLLRLLPHSVSGTAWLAAGLLALLPGAAGAAQSLSLPLFFVFPQLGSQLRTNGGGVPVPAVTSIALLMSLVMTTII